MKQIVYALTLMWIAGGAQAADEEAIPLDHIVAVVNDEIIAHTALQQEVKLFHEELRRRQGTVRLPPAEVLEKQVLDRLILKRLQLQLAGHTGIRVDDTELNDALRDIARQNNIRLPQLREVLESDGYNFVEFRENIREDIILQRLRQRHVVNRVNVSEREIEDFLSNLAQQGKISDEYHILHILVAVPEAAAPEVIAERKAKAEAVLAELRGGADFRETAMRVSDSRQALDGGDLGWRKGGEVPSLFAQSLRSLPVGDVAGPFRNPSGFHIIKLENKRGMEKSLITQTRARHILIKTSEIVSDEQARLRVQNLYERLRGGDDFAQLAGAHSEDPVSASQGGDLDWIDSGVMVPEFEEIMNRLQPGDLSEPFRTRFGWHVLQVMGRRVHDNTKQAMRSKAAHQIRSRKIEEEMQSWLRQLREEAYVEYRLE